MLKDQQEWNDSVVGIVVIPEVVVRAHLAGEDRVFLSHAILDERVSTLRNNRLCPVLRTDFDCRPNHARIENDFVVVAVLAEENVSQQGCNVSTRYEFAVL